MTIKVTQEDIVRGTQGSMTRCPVALALEESLKTEVRVIGNFYPEPLDELPHAAYLPLLKTKWNRLPDTVREFISNYDNGNPVAPFEFDLPL